MKNCRPLLIVIVALFLSISGSPAGDSVELQTVKGKTTAPLESADNKPVVLIFIATDCPIANGYVPEINRIYEKYSAQGVKFTLVHPEPSTSDGAALEHAAEYSLKPPVVVDRKHTLVAAANATTTPEVAVFDGSQKLIYRGRIDDRYSDYGDRKPEAKVHNLRDALDAALLGNPIPLAHVPALGCLIEPLPSPEKGPSRK